MKRVRLLSVDEIKKYRNQFEILLKYCKMGSGEIPEDSFLKQKIEDLIWYVSENKAYLFASFDEDLVTGFIWACKIENLNTERFHILYFAVLPNYRKSGLGNELISVAEEKAKSLGINKIELNVNARNNVAFDFYTNRNYKVERMTMVKDI